MIGDQEDMGVARFAGRSGGPSDPSPQAVSAVPAPATNAGDWAPEAALNTLNYADHPLAVRDANGRSIEHASWMLTEIVAGNIEGDKAHRWLGYAQGLLVADHWLTLEEAKLANKNASDQGAASVDTLPKGRDGEAGSVRSKGSAVGAEGDETPKGSGNA